MWTSYTDAMYNQQIETSSIYKTLKLVKGNYQKKKKQNLWYLPLKHRDPLNCEMLHMTPCSCVTLMGFFIFPILKVLGKVIG